MYFKFPKPCSKKRKDEDFRERLTDSVVNQLSPTDLIVVAYPKWLSWHPKTIEADCSEIWSLRAHFSLHVKGTTWPLKSGAVECDRAGFQSLLLPIVVWRRHPLLSPPGVLMSVLGGLSSELSVSSELPNIALQAGWKVRSLKMKNNYSSWVCCLWLVGIFHLPRLPFL